MRIAYQNVRRSLTHSRVTFLATCFITGAQQKEISHVQLKSSPGFSQKIQSKVKCKCKNMPSSSSSQQGEHTYPLSTSPNVSWMVGSPESLQSMGSTVPVIACSIRFPSMRKYVCQPCFFRPSTEMSDATGRSSYQTASIPDPSSHSLRMPRYPVDLPPTPRMETGVFEMCAKSSLFRTMCMVVPESATAYTVDVVDDILLRVSSEIYISSCGFQSCVRGFRWASKIFSFACSILRSFVLFSFSIFRISVSVVLSPIVISLFSSIS